MMSAQLRWVANSVMARSPALLMEMPYWSGYSLSARGSRSLRRRHSPKSTTPSSFPAGRSAMMASVGRYSVEKYSASFSR